VLLPPQSASYDFTLPPDFTTGAVRIYFSVTVAGDSPDDASFCALEPWRSVLFP
jgi:hypothetical protein